MNEAIEKRVELAITEKTFPGCVIGIVRANGARDIQTFGKMTYDSGSQTVAEDTIYDLASVTKSIPVASLAALFVAEARLNLDDTIVSYIPELQNDFGATIEDLLRYRVRGPRMSTVEFPTFEQIRTHIFESGFDAPPGESTYTNLPAFLLGIVLERVGGEILPALAHKYFFDPLGMRDTTFFPHDIERVAPTEIVEGKEIRGIVHDESARVFALKCRAVGHAGLFSTVPDLLNFIEALLRYRGESSVSIVYAAERGLGWHVQQQWFMGQDLSVQRGESSLKRDRFGKTGFTGTSVVVDRNKGIGLVILSNGTFPQRPPDAGSINSAINLFRAYIAETVFSS